MFVLVGRVDVNRGGLSFYPLKNEFILELENFQKNIEKNQAILIHMNSIKYSVQDVIFIFKIITITKVTSLYRNGF